MATGGSLHAATTSAVVLDMLMADVAKGTVEKSSTATATAPCNPCLSACARTLAEVGLFSYAVSASTAELFKKSFAVAREALDHLERCEMLSPGCDSANASGSHRLGALSEYNTCREGFVFSNGVLVSIEGVESFEPAMAAFARGVFDVAHSVLASIESELALPRGWFKSVLGPFAQHSQWHLKRYVPEAASPHDVTDDGKHVLLPVHSDPSLISLVLHDAPGVQPGAMGLEYLYHPHYDAKGGDGAMDRALEAAAAASTSSAASSEPSPAAASMATAMAAGAAAATLGGPSWHEVAVHGHGVVSVLNGSVLDRLSGGHYRALKHRVALREPHTISGGRRVVATFFVRPSPLALLVPPPSALLPASCRRVKPMSFEAWRRKVAEKYERHTRYGTRSTAGAAGTVLAADLRIHEGRTETGRS